MLPKRRKSPTKREIRAHPRLRHERACFCICIFHITLSVEGKANAFTIHSSQEERWSEFGLVWDLWKCVSFDPQMEFYDAILIGLLKVLVLC